MERSGAMITWNHFFPNQEAPRLIDHIQDRDLWQFQNSETEKLGSNLSYPYDFDIWDKLMETRCISSFPGRLLRLKKTFKRHS